MHSTGQQGRHQGPRLWAEPLTDVPMFTAVWTVRRGTGWGRGPSFCGVPWTSQCSSRTGEFRVEGLVGALDLANRCPLRSRASSEWVEKRKGQACALTQWCSQGVRRGQASRAVRRGW